MNMPTLQTITDALNIVTNYRPLTKHFEVPVNGTSNSVQDYILK